MEGRGRPPSSFKLEPVNGRKRKFAIYIQNSRTKLQRHLSTIKGSSGLLREGITLWTSSGGCSGYSHPLQKSSTPYFFFRRTQPLPEACGRPQHTLQTVFPKETVFNLFSRVYHPLEHRPPSLNVILPLYFTVLHIVGFVIFLLGGFLGGRRPRGQFSG